MTKAVQRRRGTNAEHSSFTGLEGELSVNTTNDSVHVHDGATAGGFELARADGSNVDNFAVGGDLDVTGNVTIGGNITIGDADTDSININADLTSSLIPNADDTYDLGTASKQWRNLYIDGTANVDSLVVDGDAEFSGNVLTTGTVNAGDGNQTDCGIVGAWTGGATLQARFGSRDATQNGYDSIVRWQGSTDVGAARYADIRLDPDAYTFNIMAPKATGPTIDAVSIDSSGNVGIGTTSPADELHINTTGANVNLRLTRDTATGARISGSAGAATPAIIFETIASSTATERMRIDSSGNVGIGASSPSSRMHIKQSVDNFYSGYRVERSSNTAQYGIFANWGGATWLGSVDTGGGGNEILVFGNSTNGTTFNERMRIDSSGDVTIGGGIYLGGTAAANLLDDYEEGTWTMIYSSETGSFGSITYDPARFSKYTKIGNLVNLCCRMRTDSMTKNTAADRWYLSTPFTCNADAYGAVNVGFTQGFLGEHPESGLVPPSNNVVYFYTRATLNGALNNKSEVSDLATGTNANDIMFTAMYLT